MGGFQFFPFSNIKNGSKVVIFGAGEVGVNYIRQIRVTDYCKIIFVVDSNASNSDVEDLRQYAVYTPDIFATNSEFDYVIIATENKEYQKEMMRTLYRYGIPDEKVVCENLFFSVKNNTYSQHGEDLIIYNAFQHMGFFQEGRLPSYIDVGAHHPYKISNTALFYQLGCRGINIEADPELIKAFEKDRPDDVNLCVGIGKEEGKQIFYITDNSALNTFRKENLDFNEFLVEHDTGKKQKISVCKTIEIPVQSLNEIIKKYCDGKWPDFMSIDIEGMEFDALSVCDFSKGPALIAVEVNFDGDRFVDMLGEKGYFPYLWYRENILFVKNEYECMVHAHERRHKK